jgi:glycosyltransferase involved in cell wall biosynthesis
MSNIHSAPRYDQPRVLHLLKWLPRGGIETWLTHVFAAGAGGAYRHEVLLMQDEIGPYEPKVRAAGVAIHTLPMTGKIKWFVDLYCFLKQEGPFDVFHAHVDSIVSGPALAVAARAGVPVRIIHNHAARSTGADYQKLRFKLREGLGNAIAMRASTMAIGISDFAMQHLAGTEWRRRKDCTLLLYGFDYSSFRGAADRASELRRTLGIAPSKRVVGHVGRFDPVKNHGFLLDSFAVCAASDPDAVLVLVGRGPLQGNYEEQARRLGIAERVIFAGGTDDIAAYMAMFNIFVFTSFSEGLGIVLLEAQAAGTPVLMPDNMPAEVVVAPNAVTLLPLQAGVERWSAAIGEILGRSHPDRDHAFELVERSVFGMGRCVADLEAIYARGIAKAR